MDNNQPDRVEILGVPVDCVDIAKAIDWTEDHILTGTSPKTIIAVNPEKIMIAHDNSELLALMQSAGLLIPDGIGVVFATRFLGLGRMQRVPGAELMPAICELSARKGYRLFLYGGRPEINQRAVARLKEAYRGIRIVGQQHGYLKKEAVPSLITEINDSGAEVLFLALGSPAQELWMAKHLPKLNIKVCQGVGGTLDVISGVVRRAPLVFRKMHLEWFYRLVTHPNRITRQIVYLDFTLQVIRQRLFR